MGPPHPTDLTHATHPTHIAQGLSETFADVRTRAAARLGDAEGADWLARTVVHFPPITAIARTRAVPRPPWSPT